MLRPSNIRIRRFGRRSARVAMTNPRRSPVCIRRNRRSPHFLTSVALPMCADLPNVISLGEHSTNEVNRLQLNLVIHSDHSAEDTNRFSVQLLQHTFRHLAIVHSNGVVSEPIVAGRDGNKERPSVSGQQHARRGYRLIEIWLRINQQGKNRYACYWENPPFNHVVKGMVRIRRGTDLFLTICCADCYCKQHESCAALSTIPEHSIHHLLTYIWPGHWSKPVSMYRLDRQST